MSGHESRRPARPVTVIRIDDRAPRRPEPVRAPSRVEVRALAERNAAELGLASARGDDVQQVSHAQSEMVHAFAAHLAVNDAAEFLRMYGEEITVWSASEARRSGDVRAQAAEPEEGGKRAGLLFVVIILLGIWGAAIAAI